MTLQNIKQKSGALLYILGALSVMFLQSVSTVAQVTVPDRYVQIADPRPGQVGVNYTVGFTVTGPGYVIGSFTLLFCDNTPLIGQPCTPPVGFDVSSAIINNQSGITDFSIAPGATANSLLFTRAAAFVGPTITSIELSGVTNPSNIGTYYGRLQVYPTEDATGIATSEGGTAFSISNPIDLETEVPPYLTLCVAITLPGYLCDNASGNFIDFGELSSTSTKTGTSQFVVATNAGAGFVVYIIGNPPTSGNNVIPAMASTQPSQTGVSQFGINLRDNSNPNVGSDPVGVGSGVIAADYDTVNQFKFSSGQAIVSSNTTTADKKFTSSYIININSNQRPGIYNTTLLYIALATF